MRAYELLTDTELNRIHSATLDIMENLGVKFTQKEALGVFSDANFSVGKDGVVKFKPGEVEECIKKAPHRFIRKGMRPEYDIEFGNGHLYMGGGSHCFGTPESALYGAAAAQLGKWYNLPTNIMAGTTDSKAPDAQASYEKMMTFILPALTGTDCMSLTGGMLDFALSANYEQMVIDNEIAGQVLRIRRSFDVNDETLAVPVIKEVGHGGTYLPTEHTLKHFKDEFWFAKLADRTPYETWASKGKKDILQRAKERVEEILETHMPKGISKSRKKEVEKIVREIFKREKIDYEKYKTIFCKGF